MVQFLYLYIHIGTIMSEFFVNDKYRFLKCMASQQIHVGSNQVIKLFQQGIADILHFIKTKVNAIICELEANGYIIQLSIRRKYFLAKKAMPS